MTSTPTTADGPDSGEAPPAPDALSYEQAREALTEVVQRMESGGITLEECLALWEEGERLARICREWLAGAQARLDAAVDS